MIKTILFIVNECLLLAMELRSNHKNVALGSNVFLLVKNKQFRPKCSIFISYLHCRYSFLEFDTVICPEHTELSVVCRLFYNCVSGHFVKQSCKYSKYILFKLLCLLLLNSEIIEIIVAHLDINLNGNNMTLNFHSKMRHECV